MKHSCLRSFWRGLAGLAALVLVPAAFAGPPLLCHPFDTGGAPSLSWGGSNWRDARADYDLARLTDDTSALLTPATPVIARMETLRRAAIYAARDGHVAHELIARLKTRIDEARTPQATALARFDFGYLVETLHEVLRLNTVYRGMPGVFPVDASGLRDALAGIDGNNILRAALTGRAADPAMHFALALVDATHHRGADYAKDAALARAGADHDPLLARNLAQIAE